MTTDGDDVDRDQAEELVQQMTEARERLAQVPAATVVANHAIGLYELATIHLLRETPRFDEATVAIDAMAALVERLEGRLGPEEPTLRDALAQIRLAYVSLKDKTAG